MKTNQRNACLSKDRIHKHVPLFHLGSQMTGIIQLDGKHGHPVPRPTHQKIDMLLTDLVEGYGVFAVIQEVSQARLAQDMAAPIRKAAQDFVKTCFCWGQKWLRRVGVFQGDSSLRGWADQLHSLTLRHSRLGSRMRFLLADIVSARHTSRFHVYRPCHCAPPSRLTGRANGFGWRACHRHFGLGFRSLRLATADGIFGLFCRIDFWLPRFWILQGKECDWCTRHVCCSGSHLPSLARSLGPIRRLGSWP